MTKRSRTIAYVVIGALVALTIWVFLHGLTSRVNHAEAQATHAESKADSASAAAKTNGQIATQAKGQADALARQLERNGIHPVVDPSNIPGPRKVTGPSGPEGPAGPSPTRAQVFAAVSIYCSTGACEHGPSASQVESAVAVYCASRNDCQGARGESVTGPPGPAGGNGTDGQPGQNASDAQVQAAVNTYCDAHNGCQGPQGAAGPQGDRGPKGDPGTALPGAYTCADVTPFLHGFTVAADGSVSLDCIALLHD